MQLINMTMIFTETKPPKKMHILEADVITIKKILMFSEMIYGCFF